MEDTSGLSGPGHYNKLALLMKWPLSEVSLYTFMGTRALASSNSCLCNVNC